MSVVLRCPSCGTTRATPGQCEACHDAQVRYFCTNHAPGLWLDTSACAKCGSRFGMATGAASPPARATPARARPDTPAPASTRPRAATSGSVARRPEARPARTKIVTERRERFRAIEEEPEAVPSGLAPWQTILGAVLRARSVARDRDELPVRTGAGGCLKRLIVTVLLLALALMVALILFGRALMHDLQPY